MNIAAVYERPLIGALIELISIVVIIESRNLNKNAHNLKNEWVNLCPLLGTIEDPLSPGVLLSCVPLTKNLGDTQKFFRAGIGC